MTKLIKHPDYLLFVDTENKPAKGEKFVVMYNDESYLEILENSLEDFRDYADEDFTDECYKIIAASPKLEGVPLLPELPKKEEDVEELADKYARGFMSHSTDKLSHLGINRKQSFIAGYKAASKRWTDEDMRKAWENGNKYHKGSLIQASQFTIEKTLQSLSFKSPIGFEPEYVFCKYTDKDAIPYGGTQRKLQIVDGVLQGTYKF